MDLSSKKTAIVVITTALWLIITYLGWNNVYLVSMYLGVVLMLLYMMLGVAKQGKLSKKLFYFSLIPWAIVWTVSFYLADYYAAIFTGVMPTFTVLGFHPSFAATVVGYWIGGMLTLTAMYMTFKDEWLSQKDWDSFLERINEIKESEKGGAH
ncbi:MAG: hypothetical protein AB7V48_10595 [Sedimentibacter sp.]